ncbi:uncharacterized protein [Ptychodera flava]|uniref:uncharacterized protein n=1 Tax=Ptychodera flava TaxID=63121 RepID=UPI00396A4EBA
MDSFCEICVKNFPTHRHLVRHLLSVTHQRQLELTALDDVPSPTSSNTLSQKSLSPDICTDSEIYSSSVINLTPQEDDYVEERDINQEGCSRDQCDELKEQLGGHSKTRLKLNLLCCFMDPIHLVKVYRSMCGTY